MSQAQLLSVSSPSVSLHQGRPATNSLQVAKFFSKRHTDVLRDIGNLRSNCPEDFSQRNFASAEYDDEQGKPRPMSLLYRDGFMLLAMGYTGKKALAMKLAYIEAFNHMEAELAGKAKPTALPPTLSTAATRAPLRALVHAWAQVSHQPHAALWAQVKAHFQLSRIDDLPEDWLADALSFVQGKIDACQHTTALPSGALPSGNSSEIPNTSALPPTPQPLDVEIPSMALVPPPATPEEYAQRAKVFLADLAKLRAHTFAVFSRASFALAAPYNHRCKGDTLPAHKHPFADAMNYSIQDLSMSAVKNISSMELLVTAYVEGQKIVNA